MLKKGLKRVRELGGDPKKEIWLIDVGASKKFQNVPKHQITPTLTKTRAAGGGFWLTKLKRRLLPKDSWIPDLGSLLKAVVFLIQTLYCALTKSKPLCSQIQGVLMGVTSPSISLDKLDWPLTLITRNAYDFRVFLVILQIWRWRWECPHPK